MIRVVIDTNLYVSALINSNSRMRLDKILKDSRFDILTDKVLIGELDEVINRPKFRKYVSAERIAAFMELLTERCSPIDTFSKVLHSPDPKDDFLLALCLDGSAQYLVTGNKIDLLDLKQFERTSILSLTEFLQIYFSDDQPDQ
ncbi:putative toxin-antitoxin system toxin component, PIN family [Dyadobacter chenhuakuii]|nr:putative toxin-antitoxin system toxin component, PIN family [Dyadobacter chenhuakuii]